MKILVVSLLRIGDLVLSAPVLRGLRQRHPEAEIHLLLNRQFAGIAPLLPYVDHFHDFDRTELQRGLGEAAYSFFDSYERLTALVDGLNGQAFDVAINLTHTRLSGWLMSVIDAKEKSGLTFDDYGRPAFGSNWFRFLNDQVESEGDEVFHFTDVFRFALGLEDEIHLPALIETENGRAEAETALRTLGPGTAPILVVQALTSDAKKDWGLDRFAELFGRLAPMGPGADATRIVLLGAPFERERLELLRNSLRDQGIEVFLVILSFEGAFSFLKRSTALLTCDTSIKHLACAAGVPVIELSLGSADLHRTGAYLSGSVIIQSAETCAPCTHSKACHRATHACAERLPVDAVAMVTREVLAGRGFQLRAIAEEYKSEIEIYRVQSKVSGFRAAVSVLEPFTENALGHWIDLASRKLWIEGIPAAGEVPRTGSEIRRLAALLGNLHPLISPIEWRHMLEDFERQFMLVEARMNGFKIGLRHLRGNHENPKAMAEFVNGLIALRERIKPMAALGSFRGVLDGVIEDGLNPAFTRLRKLADAVDEIDRRTQIGLKLVRGLAQTLAREKENEKT